MRRITRSLPTVVLGFALAFAACNDIPTTPEPVDVEASEGLLGGLTGLLGGQSVDVLKRTTPLASDESVTKTIGRDGGVIRLPEAGLSVYFPAYAVRRPTSITVLAPAGDLVGYHFAPHGLQFRRDVTVIQDLSETDAPRLLGLVLPTRFVAAYFEGDLAPTVRALEILRLDILGLLGLARFEIDHFSGYVIATD